MRISTLLRSLFIVAFVMIANTVVAEPTATQKAQLKNTLQEFIDQNTICGKYQFVQDDSDLVELDFLAIHPAIFVREDHLFIMCADFKDASDKRYLIDYYVKQAPNGYLILKQIEGRQSLLSTIKNKFRF